MTDSPLTLDRITIDKTRVRDAAGYQGTVAYVGSVASASDATQVYAGVIWDDADRGKHNGTVVSKTTGELVSHFTCPSPTGASFVKVSKLDVGTMLTPAVLQERYVTLDSDERVAPNNTLPYTAATASGKNDKPIEFLGELQIRKYQQVPDLQTLSLRLLGLSSMDTAADWSRAEHVQTLDLAGNLFSDWTILGQVLASFPSLETLSLASNRLGDLGSDDGTVVKTDGEPRLQSLNVRDCHIRSVQTLLSLGRLLPNIEEIGMGQARLTDMQISQQAELTRTLANLKVLDLSEGDLESHHVEALANLPALESLSLDDNPLEQWPSTDDNGFAKLQHLQLAGSRISTWDALEGLRKCRQWQSLRLRSTPLSETVGIAAMRSQMIARFPSLTVLNASPVSRVERQEAERRYVASITRQLQNAKDESDKQAILTVHPTYASLSKEHATILESIQAEKNGRNNGRHINWNDSLSTVTIRSMAAQSCEQLPLIRRLPATLTVGRVKALLARHFGLDWDLQELSLQNDDSDSSIPIVLDEDAQTLAYFGVADGATIYMHEVDVRARQEDQQRQQQQQEEKLKQQEKEVQDYMEIQKRLAGA